MDPQAYGCDEERLPSYHPLPHAANVTDPIVIVVSACFIALV